MLQLATTKLDSLLNIYLYMVQFNLNVLQWATTEPEFNEQFVFITNIVDLPKQVGTVFVILIVTCAQQCIHFQSLAVTVWHHDKMKQNDYLGADTELCS